LDGGKFWVRSDDQISQPDGDYTSGNWLFLMFPHIDVSTHQPARSAGVYASSSPPSKAVDGSFSRNHPNEYHSSGSVTLAASWWGVQLKEAGFFFDITFYTRDCCNSNNMGNEVSIWMANDWPADNTNWDDWAKKNEAVFCGDFAYNGDSQTVKMKCGGLISSYSFIFFRPSSTDTKAQLMIPEVTVMAVTASTFNVNNMIPSDSSAAALSTKYICSENSQKKTDIFLGPPSGTVTIPTSERTKTGESVLAASYERIPDLLAPTDLKYVLTVKSCNDQGEIGLYDPSYESKMLTASGTWVNAAIGANYARGRFGETETAWVAPALDQNQWWQIDSNDGSKTVVGAAVKGRTDERSQFVKIWKFQYWDGTGTEWKWVDGGKEFDGTQSADAWDTQVDIQFDAPITTSKIRFRPWTWSGHISARMALRVRGRVCSPGIVADLSTCKAPTRYKDERGRCVACQGGMITVVDDAGTCMNLCAAGSYLLNGGCVDMTVSTCAAGKGFSTASGKPLDSEWPLQGSTANDGVCTDCTAGFFKGETAPAVCSLCIVGTYAAEGETSCADCTPGSYNDVATGGVSACKECTAGQFGSDTAAISFQQCEGCYAGQYSTAGSSECVECPIGKNFFFQYIILF